MHTAMRLLVEMLYSKSEDRQHGEQVREPSSACGVPIAGSVIWSKSCSTDFLSS